MQAHHKDKGKHGVIGEELEEAQFFARVAAADSEDVKRASPTGPLGLDSCCRSRETSTAVPLDKVAQPEEHGGHAFHGGVLCGSRLGFKKNGSRGEEVSQREGEGLRGVSRASVAKR